MLDICISKKSTISKISQKSDIFDIFRYLRKYYNIFQPWIQFTAEQVVAKSQCCLVTSENSKWKKEESRQNIIIFCLLCLPCILVGGHNELAKPMWKYLNQNNTDREDTTSNFEDVVVANYHHSLLPTSFSDPTWFCCSWPAEKIHNMCYVTATSPPWY